MLFVGVYNIKFVFFFFQAEDGIRDADVTGVQTCALPIWNIGMAVLGERLLADARHQRGLSYEVFGDVIQIGPMSRQYLLGADARQGQDGVVAEILWEQLRRLAAEGPTDEELAHEKAGFSESYSDPRWAAEEAAGQARAALFDLPSSDPESRLSEIANVTREDVARCFVQ